MTLVIWKKWGDEKEKRNEKKENVIASHERPLPSLYQRTNFFLPANYILSL